MIAQLEFLDAAFLQWLAGLSLAMFLVNQALNFYKAHIREQPSPSGTYATIAQHQLLERSMKQSLGEVDDRFQGFEGKLEQAIKDMESRRSQNVARLYDKIESSNHDLRRDVHEDIKSIHRRIDPILGLVSKLSGKLDA